MLLGGSLAQGASVVEPADERFLAGLRQRRLFELAEQYCQSRLTDSRLSPEQRASLTLELMRTWSEQAIHAAPDLRPALWSRADEMAESFFRTNPNHPQVFLIKTQQALTVLARGELARLEAEVAADPNSAVTAAREVIRRAAKLLESLSTELATAIPLRKRTDLAPEELTAIELAALLNNVRFHLARAIRNQGLSYPDGSPDRIAALTQAIEQLTGSLRELAADDSLAMKMQLEKATCQRLLKEGELTEESWQSLDSARAPASLRLMARAEWVRWHLGANRTKEALQVLSLGRQIAGEVSAELDFAHLETYVALWQASAEMKTGESNPARDRALQTVQLIEQTHGPYWGRRAEILLVRAGGQRSGGSVEILRRAADDFFLKGQMDEAVATYDKGAAAAREARDGQAAFELAYKAALVEQQRQRYSDAARRFRELALAAKANSAAASAHLLAAVNEAQAWQIDPERRDQYLSVLEEHVANWPQSATTHAARLWLGGLREREQEWRPAIEAYRAVSPDSEHSLEAIRGVERCWTAWLSQLHAAGENVTDKAREAAQGLEATVLGPDGKLPAQWEPAQRTAILAAARLRLAWTADPRAEIEQSLKTALQGTPPPSADWAADAQAQLIVAVAEQPGRITDARSIVDQLPDGSSDFWFGIARQLTPAREKATGVARAEVAQLQLAALQRLLAAAGDLSANHQAEITRMRAEGLFAAGDQAKAIAEFAALAQRLSQDGDVQAAFGEMLLASPERTDWQRGLDQWRIVASKSPARSTRWFRAKYCVALAQLKLGEKNSAAKLIRYLQATENLAASGLEQDFLTLLKQCENP